MPGPSMTGPFTPPSAQERLRAIGSTDDLSPELRRAFTPGPHFDPVPEPDSHDWLANHPEPGQGFDDFQRAPTLEPDEGRSILYLQPMGAFSDERAPALSVLRTWARAFFQMKVEVLPAADLDAQDVTSRRNPGTGQPQLLTGDLLRILRRGLPDDAFSALGITMEDLYPEASWNFVFGQASLRDRVGVYSFARYDPGYQQESPEPASSVLLRRSCKVLAHETAHMFGIRHCTFFHCLMNGSNHLAESDARPLHLCPVDLRKLYAVVELDVVERYRALSSFWRDVGLDGEARWIEERIAWIEEG